MGGKVRNIEELIPKNKFDNSCIETLKLLTDEEILPVCPQLLEWLQDGNWPVAPEVAKVLARHQKAITPLLIDLLGAEQEDGDWKFFLLAELVPLFSKENLSLLLPAIERIAEKPTSNERYSGTDEVAKGFL